MFFSIAADSMQCWYGQAAPRRAQHGKPRNAVRRMQQRAKEGEQIENLLPVAQQVDLDAAKGNLLPPQSRDDLDQMRTGRASTATR